ncbi:MAG: hypothetical protein OFPII_01950 [Osedax symbiont Rs1]|nr:MAG: hypothetical protein OFPII_01950 [Osedax symbiont Rs1]
MISIQDLKLNEQSHCSIIAQVIDFTVVRKTPTETTDFMLGAFELAAKIFNFTVEFVLVYL